MSYDTNYQESTMLPQPKGEEVTHYLVTFSGVHYGINQRQYETITAGQPDESFKIEGNFIPKKSISEILTVEKHREAYPDKEKKDYNPLQRPLQSFEDIVDQFKWTGFGNMLELVTRTHRAMRAWKGDFHSFCLKHRAVLPNGAITTMRLTTKGGRVDHVPFAYPFFAAIAKLIEARDEKKDFAEEKSWDDIINMAPKGQ